LAARDVEALQQTQQSIQSLGGESLVVATDIQDGEQVRNLVGKTLDHWGQIDVLVNNAGITHCGPLLDMRIDQIRDLVETNLMGTLWCIKEVLPHFRERGQGHIVNVSSILGKRAVPNQAVYAATKFALIGLSEAIRCELASRNVTVTTFCPSSTSTEMNQLVSGRDHPLKQFIRRRFIATSESVAKKIVRATRLRRREIVVSIPANLVVGFNRYFPRLLDWLFIKLDKPSADS
jgi:short-subunit dehydrogenase